MASDAHAHPYDLARRTDAAEAERRRLGILCAASAWGTEDFTWNEQCARSARAEGAPALVLTFGVHPQLPHEHSFDGEAFSHHSLALLETLAREKRIAAIGECGYDLYTPAYRATERVQHDLFLAHIECALRFDLPLVLHVRRAMHKIFEVSKKLSGIKALVFHSYSGTASEAASLLKRGLNAYFSLGNTLLKGAKNARAVCAAVPQERLLTESDAPYQSPRGKPYSVYANVYDILSEAARMRGACRAELEEQIDRNFKEVYGL